MVSTIPNLISLTGELLFKSEILHLKCPTVLLHLASVEEGQVDIVITLPRLLSWQGELQVGRGYKFSGLRKCFRTVGNGRNQEFYTMSDKAEYQNLPHARTDPDFTNFINVSGKIIEEREDFGMYTLESGEKICLIYLLDYAKMTIPTIGDVIVVENAHSCCDYVVACAKSCVSYKSQNPLRKSGNQSDVLRNVIKNLQLGFKDVLWMSKQSDIFREKFHRDDRTNVDYKLLFANFLQQVYKLRIRRQPAVRFLSYEFLSKDHVCPAYTAILPMYRILRIKDLRPTPPPPLGLWSRSSNLWSPWDFMLTHRKKETYLLGILELDCSTGNLKLFDKTETIKIEILDDGSGKMSKLHGFLNSCISIKNFVFVSESFRGEEPSSATELSLIAARVEDVARVPCDAHAHNNLHNNNNINNNNDKRPCEFYQKVYESTPIYRTLDPVKCYQLNATTTGSSASHERTGNEKGGTYSRQFFILLHKTSVSYDSRFQGFEFSLYVASLGPFSEIGDHDRSSDINLSDLKFREKCIVCCKEEFLQCYPFLVDFGVYEVRIPKDEQFTFKEYAWLPRRSKIIMLDYLLLPAPVSVGIRNVSELRCDSRMDSEQLYNVQGIIIERRHLRRVDPQGDSVSASHSIFGSYLAVLTLMDITTLDTIDLYVYEYDDVIYPCALVIGAKITVKCIAKLSDKAGQFQTTCLTNIYITDIQELQDFKMRYFRSNVDKLCSPQSLQAGNVTWFDASRAKLESLSIKAVCIACNSLYGGGKCTGKCKESRGYALFATARCIAKQSTKKIIIYLSNDLVRQLLNFTLDEYRDLAAIIAADKGSFYYDSGTRRVASSLEFLRTFCDRLRFVDKHSIVLQCRVATDLNEVIDCTLLEDTVPQEVPEDSMTYLLAINLIRFSDKERQSLMFSRL